MERWTSAICVYSTSAGKGVGLKHYSNNMSSKLTTHSAHQPMVNAGFVAHVLLIEDDQSYADLVKILLSISEELRCEVTTCYTLTEGLLALEEHDFEAILLDLNLPDSRGLDTLHRLLSQRPNSNVIVLTGSADREQGIRAVGSGAQDYLIKGEFEDEQLARALRFSIERKQILKRLEEAQRIARIGHWECRPATNHFYASNEVYHFFELPADRVTYTFEDLLQEDCPLRPLLLPYLLNDNWEDKTIRQELTIEHENGTKLETLLNCQVERTEEGEVVYFGTIQDITLQKQAEELRRTRDLAVETARVREQVLANVSHELRTPMNAIVGMTNLLANTPLGGEQREYVDGVLDASQMLLGIINDILLTSSLQNGNFQLEPAPFDLQLSLRRIVDALKPKALAKGLELSLQVSDTGEGKLVGDKQRLSQILYNLVGNAVKFTHKGTIRVSATALLGDEGDHCRLRFSVEDTGMGIPPEKQKEIFQPFTRALPAGEAIEGTGLGLTIVRQLVERMGGTIELQSAPGVGTNFSFELPFLLDRTEGEKLFPKDVLPVAEESQEVELQRVLVVEDHSINQMVVEKTLLQRWPEAEVIVAESGEAAMDLLHEEKVDLILMDLQMPGIDGYATSRLIRKELAPRYAQVPIIAMTAHSQIANDDQYLQSGMNDYVLKPFDPEILFEKITEQLSK